MQSSLFDQDGTVPPPPAPGDGAGAESVRRTTDSARRSDPVSSHITVQSLARDGSIAQLVMMAICTCSTHPLHRPLALNEQGPVTDDDVWFWLEGRTQRRWQRNVIARCRGRLERDDYLERVPDIEGPHGRPVIAYIPTSKAIEWWQRGASCPST